MNRSNLNRSNLFVAGCTGLLVLLGAMNVTQAEEPPCAWTSTVQEIKVQGIDCIDVGVSSCFNALEGSVENNCLQDVILVDWPLAKGETIVIVPDDFFIFGLLDESGPAGLYDEVHEVRLENGEEGSISFKVDVMEAPSPPDGEGEECSTAGVWSGRSAGGAGWWWLLSFLALAALLRKRCTAVSMQYRSAP